MARDRKFTVLGWIPKHVIGGMHPDTRKILDQIRTTRRRVLECQFKTAREAKNRMDALRRAKSRGYAGYKEARREGNMLYLRLR